MSTADGLANKFFSFLAILKLFSNSCIKTEDTAAFFFAVHRTLFNQQLRMHAITCHKLISTVPSPYPAFSPDSSSHTRCVVVVSDECTPGHLVGKDCSQEAGHTVSCAGPHAAHVLETPDRVFKSIFHSQLNKIDNQFFPFQIKKNKRYSIVCCQCGTEN